MFELDTTLKKIAASIVAIGTIGTFAYGFGEVTELRPPTLKEFNRKFTLVMDQTQQNTQSLIYLEFWRLDDLKKLGILDFEKMQKYCELAALLRYFQVKECVFTGPGQNGQFATAVPAQNQ